MQWDNYKIAQQFLRQAHALHPNEARSEGRFEEELARQELYYECYMASFSKEKLVEFLHAAIGGSVKIPEDVEVDEAKYRSFFVEQAKRTLSEVEKT